VYDVVLPDDLNAGVTAISLVLNPAIQSPFVALSAEKPLLHFSAEPMKQVVTGPALIPDQPIFRLSADNKGYYLRFSRGTIEAISRRFMASANLAATTHEHQIALAGNHVVESWIVTDPQRDKSAALGLSVPVGTWMLSVHIPDSEYWQREILSGNRTGFSVEAYLDLAEPALFTREPQTPARLPMKTKKKHLLRRLLDAIFLSYEQLEDGRQIEIDDDTKVVYLIDADGNRGEMLADGTYTLESGETLTVAESQSVNPADAASSDALSSRHAEGPAPVEDVRRPDGTSDAVAAGEALTDEAPADAPAAADEKDQKIDELEAEIKRLKSLLAENEKATQSLNATVADINAKLAAQPAAKPVKLAAVPAETTLTPAQARLARAHALRG
jgi:hypothetical protein